MDWLLLLLLHFPCLDTIMYRLESVRMLQANPAYAVLFVVSMLFPALASIFKERIFAKEVGFISNLLGNSLCVSPCTNHLDALNMAAEGASQWQRFGYLCGEQDVCHAWCGSNALVCAQTKQASGGLLLC